MRHRDDQSSSRKSNRLRQRRALHHAVRACMERLEERRLLSVTWNVTDNTLNVIGDGANDVIGVSVYDSGYTRLRLTHNGATEQIDYASFDQINIVSDGGDDVVAISDAALPFLRTKITNIDLGTGTDQLTVTTNGNATLVNGMVTTKVGNAFEGTATFIGEEKILISGGASDELFDATGYDRVRGYDPTGTGTRYVILRGNAGNDTLLGGPNGMALLGGTGSLDQADGDDVITGGPGDDLLNGGLGNNTVDGGGGTNRLALSADVDTTLTDWALTSSDSGGVVGVTSFLNISMTNLSGGPGNNILDASGSSAAGNSLYGGAGNDTLIAGPQGTYMNGGLGDDMLHGGAGNDRMFDGDGGNDTFIGNGGADNVTGGAGDDYIYASPGNDGIDGGTGIDTLRMDASSGNDNLLLTINTAPTSSSLGAGTSQFGRFQYVENVSIDAGEGNDTFAISGVLDFNLTVLNLEPVVNAGVDLVLPGSVLNANVSFSDPFDPDNNPTATIDYGDGTGVQTLAINADGTLTLAHLFSQLGTYTVTITVTDSQGSIGTDSLLVTVNTLNSAVTWNTPDGTPGNRTLNIFGTAGNDSITFSYYGPTTISVKRTDGTSAIFDRSTFDHVNIVTDGGDDSVSFSDRTGAILPGKTMAIDLGAGTDTLSLFTDGNLMLVNGVVTTKVGTAGAGRATFIGEERVNVYGGDSDETIDATGYTHVSAVLLSGIGGNDTILAGVNGMTLSGGIGDDTMVGGAGRDIIDAGTGTNTVVGGGGLDNLRGSGDFDITLDDTTLTLTDLAGNVAGFTTFTGIDNTTLSGGNGNNIIDASVYSRANYLYGEGGNDTLIASFRGSIMNGGLGDDTLTGSPAFDSLSGSAGNDTLTGNGGNDDLFGDDGVDTASIDATAGNDTILVTTGTLSSVRVNGIQFGRYQNLENLIIDAGDGLDTASVSGILNTNLKILHLEPVVIAGSDMTLPGTDLTAFGAFTDAFDPDNRPIATVNYGDGSGVHSLTLNADGTYALAHTYSVEGVFAVTVTVTDSQGSAGSDSLLVTVNNVNQQPTVTVNTLNQTYDGTAYSGATISVDSGDTGVQSFTYYAGNDLLLTTPIAAPINAGSYLVVGHVAAAPGYFAGDSAAVTFTIAKADAIISAEGYTGTYDGQSHGATGSATGVGGVDLGAGLNLGATFTNAPGGTATWTFSGGTNYNDASGSVAITIAKADATITVNGYIGTYHGAAHGATGSATGVGGVDLGAGLNLGATFTNAPGGTATWTFSGGTNYNDASGSVAITIGKADAVIAVSGMSFVYDGLAHSLSGGTATGVQLEDLSGLLTIDANSRTEAGTTSVNWSFAGNENYNSASGTATLTITQADLDATASTQDSLNIAKAGTLTFTLADLAGIVDGQSNYELLNGALFQLTVGANTYSVTSAASVASDGTIRVTWQMSEDLYLDLQAVLGTGTPADKTT